MSSASGARENIPPPVLLLYSEPGATLCPLLPHATGTNKRTPGTKEAGRSVHSLAAAAAAGPALHSASRCAKLNTVEAKAGTWIL